jgi:hypothetical protein
MHSKGRTARLKEAFRRGSTSKRRDLEQWISQPQDHLFAAGTNSNVATRYEEAREDLTLPGQSTKRAMRKSVVLSSRYEIPPAGERQDPELQQLNTLLTARHKGRKRKSDIHSDQPRQRLRFSSTLEIEDRPAASESESNDSSGWIGVGSNSEPS